MLLLPIGDVDLGSEIRYTYSLDRM